MPRRSRRSRCPCARRTGAASARAPRAPRRQRLAAALLAQRSAGSQTEVQVVEDLSRLFVGHPTHCIACFAGEYSHPARLRPAFRGGRRPGSGAGARGADRAGRPGARDRERRSDPPGPPRRARAGGGASCASSAARCSPSPATTTSRTPSRRASRAPGASSSASGRRRSRLVSAQRPRRRAQLGAAVAPPVGRRRRRQLERATSELRAAAPGALRVVVLHHQLIGAPWRTRKKPVARRNHVLAMLVDSGAELIVGGHIHQAAVCERHEFEVITGDARGVVVSIAPGLGQPRPQRRGEARGVRRLPRRRTHADRRDLHLARRRLGAHGVPPLPART